MLCEPLAVDGLMQRAVPRCAVPSLILTCATGRQSRPTDELLHAEGSEGGERGDGAEGGGCAVALSAAMLARGLPCKLVDMASAFEGEVTADAIDCVSFLSDHPEELITFLQAFGNSGRETMPQLSPRHSADTPRRSPRLATSTHGAVTRLPAIAA